MRHLLKIFCLLSLVAGSLHAAPAATKLWTTNVYFSLISSIRFNPSGNALASGSYSGPARLWSVTNAILIRTFTIPQNDVVAAAFSRDGIRLFGGGGSGGYRAWRVSDGAVFFGDIGPGSGYGQAAYSPNGLYLAKGRTGVLTLNHADSGEGITFLGDEPHESVLAVEFSPDSTLLGSSGANDTAKLWRVSDGELLQTFPYGAIAFTPDGKYFCYDNHDGTAIFWDVQTNGIARIFPAWGSAVRFTANGQILVTVNGPLINLWRVATGALLASYDTAPDGTARSLDVSPDARLFAYGTYSGTVVLARMPVTLDTITRTGNETILHWQGGSGLYQLQSNPNFTTNGWQNLGTPTTNTVATNVSTTTLFFRVQSLPNP